MPRSQIGDSYDSLMDFRLYEHPYSSDISKCYLRVLVDNLTAKFRLIIWFKDPLHMKGMIVFKGPTMDFADSCSSLVIRIIQEKFLPQLCKLKQIISNRGYADNYSGSFPSWKKLFTGICGRQKPNFFIWYITFSLPERSFHVGYL